LYNTIKSTDTEAQYSSCGNNTKVVVLVLVVVTVVVVMAAAVAVVVDVTFIRRALLNKATELPLGKQMCP